MAKYAQLVATGLPPGVSITVKQNGVQVPNLYPSADANAPDNRARTADGNGALSPATFVPNGTYTVAYSGGSASVVVSGAAGLPPNDPTGPDPAGTFAPLPTSARHPVLGWYLPEGYGTVTYGKGVTQAQAIANAAAVQAAHDACRAGATGISGGGTVLIRDVISCYTPAAVAALTLSGGVTLRGSGVGGDIYSNNDPLLPFGGSCLRLQSGSDQDLIRTENFATLTGQASPSAYDVPSRFAICDLTLDGNKTGNSSGWVLRIYGKAYRISNVIIQNGASGGAYSEYGAGGYEMEAKWSDFRITDNGGDGLEWRGPHDSQFINGSVNRNDGNRGIYIVPSTYTGGEQWTNVHCFGAHSEQWVIGGTNAYFANCTSDGGGITLLGSGNVWQGTIYGTLAPGQYAVKLGDGVARTVERNQVRGRVYNFKGSPFIWYDTRNLTNNGNRFEAVAEMGASTRYQANGALTTLTSAAASGATTLNVVSAALFPASGTVYADDGTNRTASITYTGKTATTLTGVTGVPGAGLASGAGVYVASDPFNNDSFQIWDYSATGSAGILAERSTSVAQGNHTATKSFTGVIAAAEGLQTTNNVRITGGSGVPTRPGTRDPAVGDIYVRTDTTGTVNQRIYICTVGGGTPTWVGLV